MKREKGSGLNSACRVPAKMSSPKGPRKKSGRSDRNITGTGVAEFQEEST